MKKSDHRSGVRPVLKASSVQVTSPGRLLLGSLHHQHVFNMVRNQHDGQPEGPSGLRTGAVHSPGSGGGFLPLFPLVWLKLQDGLNLALVADEIMLNVQLM